MLQLELLKMPSILKLLRFRDFPKWVKTQNFSKEDKQNKKIAMFCTGGIRCEKASSFMMR